MYLAGCRIQALYTHGRSASTCSRIVTGMVSWILTLLSRKRSTRQTSSATCFPGVGISVHGQEPGLYTSMACFLSFSGRFLRLTMLIAHVSCDTCRCHLQEATLSLPYETVKAFVGCQELTLFGCDDWCCTCVSKCRCHADSHLKVGSINCSGSLSTDVSVAPFVSSRSVVVSRKQLLVRVFVDTAGPLLCEVLGGVSLSVILI